MTHSKVISVVIAIFSIFMATFLIAPWNGEYAYADGKIYWTDGSPGGGAIRRSDLDGGNIQTYFPGIALPSIIAVDRLGGKVYWRGDGMWGV